MSDPRAALIVRSLDEIISHLTAASRQRAPSDDAIIAEHIDLALAHAKDARAKLTIEQPMRCYWCGEVHFGGPNKCGNPDARPAHALSTSNQTEPK